MYYIASEIYRNCFLKLARASRWVSQSTSLNLNSISISIWAKTYTFHFFNFGSVGSIEHLWNLSVIFFSFTSAAGYYVVDWSCGGVWLHGVFSLWLSICSSAHRRNRALIKQIKLPLLISFSNFLRFRIVAMCTAAVEEKIRERTKKKGKSIKTFLICLCCCRRTSRMWCETFTEVRRSLESICGC